MSKSIERLLWAVIIISVGVVMLGTSLDLVNVNIWSLIWKFWPVVFIIPGISSLAQGKWFWGIALILIGTSIVINNFTDINVWRLVFPVIVIGFGLTLLFKPESLNNGKGVSDDDYLSGDVIFSGLDRKLVTKKFKGGKLDVVFGGAKIDLTEIELKDSAKIEVNAVFGGAEIFVNPKKYNIMADGTGVFGGWTNKFQASHLKKPVLTITGAAVFGGVEIK